MSLPCVDYNKKPGHGAIINTMNYYLTRRAVLKWLESPAIYHLAKDELYELDNDSFSFMKNCASNNGCVSKDSAFIDYCVGEGLLTSEPVSIKRPLLAKAAVPSLRYLELQITSACNLRCRHCYIDDDDRRELPFAQIRDVLREFEDMQGLRVMITGGEPLLHRSFEAINEILPDYSVRKALFTNGMLLRKEILKSLKIDEIQISIDGLETAHDALRGNGTFHRAMEAVTNSLESGFDVSISTMVHRGNLLDFDEMEHLFKRLGIKEWTVDVPCTTGRLRENARFSISPEEGGKYLGYGYGGGLHATGLGGYACGLHLMSVMANGNIAKCTFYGDRTVGTVDQGLLSSWHKIQPVRLNELACACDFIETCRGGCRYRAELIDGPRGRDLYRCALYGIINDKVSPFPESIIE
jgi:radical SAM protein with 4Fe4S-binding SPASM domain